MVAIWTPRSGRARVTPGPLGEGGTGDAPKSLSPRPTPTPSQRKGQPSIFIAFLIWKCSCSSHRPNPSLPGTHNAGRARCAAMYIYTAKLYREDMTYLVSLDVFSQTLLKRPWNYLEQQCEGEKQISLRFPAWLHMPLKIAKHQTNTLAQMLKLLNLQVL